MKKFTLVISSLLFAVLLNAQGATAQTSPVTASPAMDITKILDIQEANHDFGKIPWGKPAEFDVVIKNISKDSVRIETVKAGCGCTTPKWQPGPYAPGETFKVTMGFNGYTEGHFEKFVDITFTNGLSKQVKFSGEGYKVAENAAPANGVIQKMKGLVNQ